MAANPEIYERHDLCNELAPGMICFRSKTYANGTYANDLHEHVPAHRISQDHRIATLRSLLARYAGWAGQSIIHSNLNARAGEPARYPVIDHRITYPQPGVQRHYASSGNTHTWFDKVVSAAAFARDA